MNAEKRQLKLQNADEIAAEVRRLRRGHRKTANWSLNQVCWHLNTVMTVTMAPGPHVRVQVDAAAKAKLAHLLAGGEIAGVKAPERAMPPEVVGDEVVEQFLATLERFKAFAGPFAPHRLFGEIAHEDYMRLHLIHAAHHLGFLIPADM